MPKYTVRRLSYGWEVRWDSVDAMEPEIAIVIIEQMEGPIYRCCRCGVSKCDHCQVVRSHEEEGAEP